MMLNDQSESLSVRKITRKPRSIRPLVSNRIPIELLENPRLNEAIKALPANYNFELFKVIWTIKRDGYKRVALQFPDGLLMYSLTISDILEEFANVDTVVMGDVVYGACCIDDYTATALECDFLIHYGHSCLVPITSMLIKAMYVFVDIKFNSDHLVASLKKNLKPGSKIALAATVQFITSLDTVKRSLDGIFDIVIPQAKPLSSGEILGCTAPEIDSSKDYEALVFVGDGRFHLEALLIANKNLPSYLYNTYSSEFTKETYDHHRMLNTRRDAIKKARTANKIGLILGTLGRQGSVKVLKYLRSVLDSLSLKHCTVLLSEITPDKLRAFNHIDAWIQTACPRLSIDWGAQFSTPVLTPYEAAVAFKETSWKSNYPMNFYSYNSHEPWTPLNK